MTKPKKSDSEYFGQDSLKFGVDGQDQGAEFGWNVGVFVKFLKFRLCHGDAHIEFFPLLRSQFSQASLA